MSNEQAVLTIVTGAGREARSRCADASNTLQRLMRNVVTSLFLRRSLYDRRSRSAYCRATSRGDRRNF